MSPYPALSIITDFILHCQSYFPKNIITFTQCSFIPPNNGIIPILQKRKVKLRQFKKLVYWQNLITAERKKLELRGVYLQNQSFYHYIMVFYHKIYMQKHILAFLCLPHQSILLGFPGHLRHGSNQDWMCNLWGPVSKLKYQHPCSKRSQNFRISRPYSKAAYRTRGPSQHGALGRHAGHMHLSQALTLPPTDLICQESPQFCCSFPNPSCHLYYFFFHVSFVSYLLCFPCPNLLRLRWIPPHTLISLNSQDLVSDDLDGPFYKFSGF